MTGNSQESGQFPCTRYLIGQHACIYTIHFPVIGDIKQSISTVTFVTVQAATSFLLLTLVAVGPACCDYQFFAAAAGLPL